MHPINSLAIIYLLFTLSSSAIIYGAFQGKLDLSAKYFLTAELLMSVVAGVLFLQNTFPELTNSYTLALANFCTLSSEIAIFFSIQNLVKKVSVKRYFFALFGVLLVVAFLEILRHIDGTKIIVLLFNVLMAYITFSIYLLSKNKLGLALQQNQFMSIFRRFEFALFVCAILRGASFLSSTPLVPRDSPGAVIIIFYAAYIAISVFRYLSYIGLRMTWVDPHSSSPNSLNRGLAKALEEKDELLRGLIASNRVIGISALAGSLAHQLSQPLTAISLQADRSKRELVKSVYNPVLLGSLEEISTQSSKLAELVQNLRQLFSSRTHEFEPFNLHGICGEILEIVSPALQSKKISLIQNVTDDPMVLGDTIQIQQVLINVFNNAIDVISHSDLALKEIQLTISQNENFGILRIQDSGVGIDPAILPVIFELYKTTKQGGLGVGLWLSKTIMERHHGSITALNGVNGGAVFEIQIPLAKASTKTPLFTH